MAPSLSVEESQLRVLDDQDVQYSREERTSQRENPAMCRVPFEHEAEYLPGHLGIVQGWRKSNLSV